MLIDIDWNDLHLKDVSKIFLTPSKCCVCLIHVVGASMHFVIEAL